MKEILELQKFSMEDRKEIEFDSIEILDKLISSLSITDTSNSGFFYGLSGSLCYSRICNLC